MLWYVVHPTRPRRTPGPDVTPPAMQMIMNHQGAPAGSPRHTNPRPVCWCHLLLLPCTAAPLLFRFPNTALFLSNQSAPSDASPNGAIVATSSASLLSSSSHGRYGVSVYRGGQASSLSRHTQNVGLEARVDGAPTSTTAPKLKPKHRNRNQRYRTSTAGRVWVMDRRIRSGGSVSLRC